MIIKIENVVNLSFFRAISEQVEDTVSQIKSRNRELKQAIDILDGKKVDRSQDILEYSTN